MIRNLKDCLDFNCSKIAECPMQTLTLMLNFSKSYYMKLLYINYIEVVDVEVENVFFLILIFLLDQFANNL